MKTWKKVLLIIAASIGGLIVLLFIQGGISNCFQNQKLSKSSYENKDLKWPTDGIATLLSKPESSNGYISTSSAERFSCTVAKTNDSAFNGYLQKCKEKGFTVDSSYSSTSYDAKDSSGNKLHLFFYESSSEMYIDLDSKAYLDKEAAQKKAIEEKKAQSNSNSNNNSSNNSGSSTGVSADLKSFLDSYEQFIDKYVAFMKKYKESGNPVSMLKDYTDLMNQFSDFNNKIASYDAKKGSMSQ